MQIRILLDDENHEFIKEKAKQNRRSFTQELNAILDEVRTMKPELGIPRSIINSQQTKRNII